MGRESCRRPRRTRSSSIWTTGWDVEVGKLADLIVLDGNPLKNVGLFADGQKTVRLVLKEGRVMKNLAGLELPKEIDTRAPCRLRYGVERKQYGDETC